MVGGLPPVPEANIMASDQSTVDFIIEQMSRGNDVRAKKMFGEYGVYCGDTFVGVICEDQLYLKITDAGRAMVPHAEEGSPYKGAKPHLVIPEELVEDGERLSELARATADALPAPKPKKAKRP
jgi:DNA transformation protein and related proteins